MLHDTHLHLDLILEKLININEIKKEQINNNATISLINNIHNKLDELLQKHNWVIQIGVDKSTFTHNYNLFKTNSKVFFSIGMHPETLDFDFRQKQDQNLEGKNKNLYFQDILDLNWMENYFNNDKIIAIGECGLDYYYTNDVKIKKLQYELFIKQIDLAIKYNLPLIIHCREAFGDLLEILKKTPQIHNNFVIHCYTEGKEILKQILDFGGKIGIGGIVTFQNKVDKLKEAVNYCPLENILIETDAPFLSPTPFRGKICLPKYIENVFNMVAIIKNTDFETILNTSLNNSFKLFKKLK